MLADAESGLAAANAKLVAAEAAAATAGELPIAVFSPKGLQS
jgi:hypothetical protein